MRATVVWKTVMILSNRFGQPTLGHGLAVDKVIIKGLICDRGGAEPNFR
ncbi:hypothetical protein NKH48_14075 [Mesorhizobium sp. M1233]